MIEKIIFNALAIVLFIFVFFMMVKRNDTNYLSMLLLEAIGIGINFVELNFGVSVNFFLVILEYLLAIILPIILFIMEKRNVNYSELLTLMKLKYYTMLKKDDKVKKILVNLVTKYPDSYVGRKRLAEAFEQQGKYEDAIIEYNKAFDLNKDDLDSNFKIGDLFSKIGKKKEAEETLSDLLKREPRYYDASLLLGNILYDQQRFKEAVNIYMDALRFSPEDFDLYYNLGMAYIGLNNFQDAKTCYDKAAQINSLMYNAYYVLGQLSLIANDIEEAEKYFTESICEETEADAYYELARIYMLKKDRGNAITFIQKSIELDVKYYDIARKEPIFIPIKQYIVEPDIKKTPEIHLSQKEVQINKKLVKTVSIVEKMGFRQKNERQEKKADIKIEKSVENNTEQNIEKVEKQEATNFSNTSKVKDEKESNM